MSDNAQQTEGATLFERLLEIQRELKVSKGRTNDYGGYRFRSREDILEAAKPLCHERGCVLLSQDTPVTVDGWHYVKSAAILADVRTGEVIQAESWAREPETIKGMSAPQITGTAESYAGKRALGNLFAIDDSEDADAQQQETAPEPPAQGPFTAHCRSCGTRYAFESADQYRAFIANPGCCPAPSWEVE